MKILLLVLITYHLPPAKLVYICDSPHGKKYHLNEKCKGLTTCSHRVRKITLEQAQKSGKTLCGWEKEVPKK